MAVPALPERNGFPSHRWLSLSPAPQRKAPLTLSFNVNKGARDQLHYRQLRDLENHPYGTKVPLETFLPRSCPWSSAGQPQNGPTLHLVFINFSPNRLFSKERQTREGHPNSIMQLSPTNKRPPQARTRCRLSRSDTKATTARLPRTRASKAASSHHLSADSHHPIRGWPDGGKGRSSRPRASHGMRLSVQLARLSNRPHRRNLSPSERGFCARSELPLPLPSKPTLRNTSSFFVGTGFFDLVLTQRFVWEQAESTVR